MSYPVPKSKCKHCVEGIVLDEKCGKVIGHHYCELDSFLPGDCCTKWDCPDYERRKEGEVEE